MYEYLTGEVIRVGADHAVLEAQGIGFRLRAPARTLRKLREGASARLFISHRIRDEQIVYFGFSQPEERDFFDRICKVSGVGPASALALLSHVDPDDLRSSVLDGNTAVLEKVKGIGKKTAQRIVLDLRGALEKEQLISTVGSVASIGVPEGAPADAVRALQVLGFHLTDAQDRVRKALSDEASPKSAEELVRFASRGR
ncbi:MAG: Holliday junction branch migration protein RuvA [Bacillota bacterium]|nr:MAG: Holliday junction branch migration protein RuvA [Planctomycetota bacterium]RUA10507.1 MAG: Holliday junction branch migration protein RuvA [Bacillota bacterium]